MSSGASETEMQKQDKITIYLTTEDVSLQVN